MDQTSGNKDKEIEIGVCGKKLSSLLFQTQIFLIETWPLGYWTLQYLVYIIRLTSNFFLTAKAS